MLNKDTASGCFPIKRKFAIPLGLFIIAAVLWLMGYDTVHFINPDAFDYAQMGREIYTGHGFATAHLYPRHIPYLAEQGYLLQNIGHWPNLYRYPLPTILNAAFQWLVRDDIIAAAVVQSGFWFLISVPLLYVFINKLTRSDLVALLASLFYLGGRMFWLGSYNGMTESFSTFLILLLFYVMFNDASNVRRWLLAGILCGLSYLARTQLAFLLPFVIVFAWIKSKDFPARAVAFIILGAGMVIVPWAVRNTLLTGDPLFSFSTSRNLVLATSVHSDLETQLHAPAQTAAVISEYKSLILAKALNNTWPKKLFPTYLVGDPVFGVMLMTGIALSLLPGRAEANVNQDYVLFKWGVLAMIYTNFLVTSVAFFHPRFLVTLLPFIPIIGFQEICVLPNKLKSNRMPRLQAAFPWILLACCVLYPLPALREFIVSDQETNSNAEQAALDAIAKITGPESVIASNISIPLTVYNGNPAIMLPAFPEQLLEINRDYIAIDYVFFYAPASQVVLPQGMLSLYETHGVYVDFFETSEFLKTYRLIFTLPDGSMLYELINQNDAFYNPAQGRLAHVEG